LAAVIAGAWLGCSDAADRRDPGDSGEQGQPDAPAAGQLPCEVERVLRARCQECHTAPPKNGAPFPLLTYANTQADYFGKPIYERMRVAIDTDFMPLAPREKLSDADRAVMLEWIDAGAPPADEGEVCP
jgi:uncharacterized membrane protein